MEEVRDRQLGSFAIQIQKQYRRFRNQVTFQRTKEAARTLAVSIQILAAKKQLLELRETKNKQKSQSALIIQAQVRRHFAQQQLSILKREKQTALLLQTAVRAFLARSNYIQLRDAKRLDDKRKAEEL